MYNLDYNKMTREQNNFICAEEIIQKCKTTRQAKHVICQNFSANFWFAL